MPAPTVAVTVDLSTIGGEALAGITVRARLDVNEVYEEIVISQPVEGVTDADGVVVLDLFPNAPSPTGLGTQGSTYRFTASIPGGRGLNVNARVPNEDCRLEDILVSTEAVALDAAEMAVLQAQSYASQAAAARDDAEAVLTDPSYVALAADLAIVSDSIDSVNTTADSIADVNTVAGSIASVNAVAGALSPITSVADNIPALQAALLASGTANLALSYETAFCIDATNEDTDAAVTTKIGDAVTQVSLFSLYNTSWDTPAMRMLEDGSMAWSDHNLILQSGDLGNVTHSLTGLTRAVGYEGPTGELDAALLTASASPAFMSATLSGTKISNFSGGYFLCAWKVYYDGTHRWAYIRIDSPGTLRVYFDLQTGVVGTADAGITGGISRYDADGELMDSGWYMIYAYQAVSAASFIFDIGLSDADANPAVTVAKALRVAHPQTCYGVNPLAYLESGASAVYGPAYSWETGGRTLMLYSGATYSGLYPDDLTNAAWTKTNCTAALDAVGISGEPCSTLTFTANNGTCTQATTSTGATHTFQPLIRRKTGTGAIFITMDGVEEDITSQLNTETFELVYLHGTTANPVIGFKGATSGDEIEICHANSTKSAFVSPPCPVYGTAKTMNGISLSNKTIPVTLSGNVLAYYDGYLVDDTAILSPAIWTAVDLSNSSDANMLAKMNETLNFGDASGQTTNEMYGAKEAGERVEVTIYLGGATDGNYGSVNGEPSAADYQRTVTGLDRFTMGTGSAMQFVRKFLVTPTTIDDRDEVRTKHYQGGIKNNMYASSIVAAAHEFASFTNGTDYERFPVVSLLKDYGDSVLLGVFWAGRDVDHYHQEFAIRLMQRNFVYDKVENTLTPVTNATVVCQPSRWTSNLGGSESPIVIRLTSGANAGRLIMLFCELDSVSGTLTDDKRNIYIKTNDLEGDPSGWTAATLLFDAADITSDYMLLAPGGDHVILPPNHPVAPNRIVTMYYATSNRVGCIYSDDFGATWSLGTLLTVGGVGATEPTLTMWPDGTLVSTVRGGNGLPDNRQWLTSVDGGETLTLEGTIPNIAPDADSSASTVQLDPSGVTSPQGRIAFSHSTINTRIGFQIGFATDDTMEMRDPIEPVNSRRWFAYSSLCSLFGGEYLACAVEYGSIQVEVYPSVNLMIIKP